MKIRIELTLDLDKEQLASLVKYAKDRGHGHDDNEDVRVLIRRVVSSRVNEIVIESREDNQ